MPAHFGYANKAVIVTGCASGIGKATAELLAELGAQVHGIDVQPPAIGMHSFTEMDLRSPASIDAGLDAVNGSVDALFNCAGLAPGRSSLDILKVNFIGTRYLTERVADLMPAGSAVISVSSNGGAGWAKRIPVLLQLASTGSYDEALEWCENNPTLTLDAYRLSKEVLVVWTLQYSATLIQRGIRINCTSPGAVQTPMLDEIEKLGVGAAIDAVARPIGRRSTSREQAWPLVMLNSPLASYINGANLAVDGGFTGALALK